MTLPPSDSSRDDELFQQIVAGYGTESTDPVPRWPVSEDVAEEARTTPEAEAPSYRVGPAGVPENEALPGWLEPPALEDEGHFEPPEPPRVPRPRARTVGAVVLLLAGLAVLLLPFQVGLDDSLPSLLFGVALTAGGAVLLVMGVRDAPGRDDDPDGGAVV